MCVAQFGFTCLSEKKQGKDLKTSLELKSKSSLYPWIRLLGGT